MYKTNGVDVAIFLEEGELYAKLSPSTWRVTSNVPGSMYYAGVSLTEEEAEEWQTVKELKDYDCQTSYGAHSLKNS